MRELLMSTLLPLVITGAVTAAFFLLTLAGTHLVAWAKAKSASSKLALFTSVVGDHLLGAFGEVETTMKPALMTALSDGKVTPEEAAMLKKALVDTLMKSLPGHIKAIGIALFGDALESVLGAQVQSLAASSPTTASVAPMTAAALVAGQTQVTAANPPTPR